MNFRFGGTLRLSVSVEHGGPRGLWYIQSWLARAQVNTHDLTLGEFVGEVNRPDAGTGSHVDGSLGVPQGCEEEVVAVGDTEKMMLQVEAVGFPLLFRGQSSECKMTGEGLLCHLPRR